MTESVLASFSDVKFIQGTTKMNQANWQGYFGAFLPNGVYSGLIQRQKADSSAEKLLTDGIVSANGIIAELATDNGYTDIGYVSGGGIYDRFVCIRVHFDTETAEIVEKTNIAASSSELNLAQTMMSFIEDESYQCTRNTTYYDIPVMYQTVMNTCVFQGVDLTRRINPGRQIQLDPDYIAVVLSANVKLLSWRDRYTTATNMTVYPDLVDLADGATLTVDASAIRTISLSEIPFTVNNADLTTSQGAYNLSYSANWGIKYIFSNSASWTHNATDHTYEYTVAQSTPTVFRLTFVGLDVSSSPSWNFKFIVETF